MHKQEDYEIKETHFKGKADWYVFTSIMYN